jgi:hypothetical protein
MASGVSRTSSFRKALRKRAGEGRRIDEGIQRHGERIGALLECRRWNIMEKRRENLAQALGEQVVNAFVVLDAGLNLDQAIGDMVRLERGERARKIDRRKVENVVVLERQLDAEDYGHGLLGQNGFFDNVSFVKFRTRTGMLACPPTSSLTCPLDPRIS